MMWFGLVRISHSCQILSVESACLLSLATSDVPTPVKTIVQLFRPAFGVFSKTSGWEPVDRGKPGWERLTTICTRSILAWRRQGSWRRAADRPISDIASTLGVGYVYVTCSGERVVVRGVAGDSWCSLHSSLDTGICNNYSSAVIIKTGSRIICVSLFFDFLFLVCKKTLTLIFLKSKNVFTSACGRTRNNEIPTAFLAHQNLSRFTDVSWPVSPQRLSQHFVILAFVPACHTNHRDRTLWWNKVSRKKPRENQQIIAVAIHSLITAAYRFFSHRLEYFENNFTIFTAD